jgi:hypothetical protein
MNKRSLVLVNFEVREEFVVDALGRLRGLNRIQKCFEVLRRDEVRIREWHWWLGPMLNLAQGTVAGSPASYSSPLLSGISLRSYKPNSKALPALRSNAACLADSASPSQNALTIRNSSLMAEPARQISDNSAN